MTNLAVLNILTEDTEVLYYWYTCVCVRVHARRASTERGDVVIHMLSSGVGGGYV